VAGAHQHWRCGHPPTRAHAQVGIALVATVLRSRFNRIEPVERVSVQPKGRSYSRTLFARGT
jgi:hypothetical protein